MRFSYFLGVTLAAAQVVCGVAVGGEERREVGRVGKRSALSTFLKDIENAASCSACEALLVVLQTVAHLGNSQFVDVITAVCTSLKLEDADVCKGAISLEGPILAHSLRGMSIGSYTSKMFCMAIFGLCPYPDVRPWTPPFPSPKPANAIRPPPSGKPPLKIVHISDIHTDLSYQTGANWNCTKNICCRPYTFSDAPGITTTPAGPYGNTHCDTPVSLEVSMYTAITQLVPNATFTLFTGDVVEGAVWLVNPTEVTNDLTDAYTRMRSPLRTVYSVVGNHDAAPVNSFPPSSIDTTISSQYVYDTLSTLWTPLIGPLPASQSCTTEGAYTTVHPGTNLRIISINTNFWYRQNFWLYEKTIQYDPDGQFAWLVGQLSVAEQAGQRVYILGHMPMGRPDALHDASNYFDQVVNRYSATIAGMFWGHTHKDEFEISYSDYVNPSAANAQAISYVAPALTPTSGNPTFRVYDVDPVTFGVLDITTYFADMSSPTYQSRPAWKKYYSVKEAYGPLVNPPVTNPAAELTPGFWHDLTQRFVDDDTTFQAYYARKSRGWNVGSCNGSCKTSEICQLRAARAQDNCAVVTPGVSFKRDEAHSHISGRDGVGSAHGHIGECDGSRAVGILRGFAGDVGAFEAAMRDVLGDKFMDGEVNITISK